ncbi:hypothetical protein, partial [Candidatus Sarmatiella mevalonica]|uniref:hypothetical protein n=1 Tax=Candidatus Sarmatiella mevalonica TaxID=2770581 RepID=UPI001A93751D
MPNNLKKTLGCLAILLYLIIVYSLLLVKNQVLYTLYKKYQSLPVSNFQFYILTQEVYLYRSIVGTSGSS